MFGLTDCDCLVLSVDCRLVLSPPSTSLTKGRNLISELSPSLSSQGPSIYDVRTDGGGGELPNKKVK